MTQLSGRNAIFALASIRRRSTNSITGLVALRIESPKSR
jgi:hypothetical protein